MKQSQKPGRRVVSRGAYALIRRQEAVKLLTGFCFGGFAFATLFYGLIVGVKFGIDTAVGLHSQAHGGMAALRTAVGLICGFVSVACFYALQGGLVEAGNIEVKSLLTRANTADLPAPESLVRASQEPAQAQESVLLRAAIGEIQVGQEEQLLRPSTGVQE